MTPATFLADILDPGLAFVAELNGPQPTDDVRRFLLCIALQESGPSLDARYQGSPSSSAGPARGFWQFEQGGGVVGVLNHAASKAIAARACQSLTVVANPAAVWRALEGHDLLATAFARLLVWTDPHPVPVTADAAWDYYLRVWRPGKPHPDAWAANWRTASLAVPATTMEAATPRPGPVREA